MLRPTFMRPCSKRRTVSSEIVQLIIKIEAAQRSVQAMNQTQPQPPHQEKKQLLSNMFPAKIKGMKNDFCGKLSEF